MILKLLTKWINKRTAKKAAVRKVGCEHPSNERAQYRLRREAGDGQVHSDPDTLVICTMCGEMRLLKLHP